MPKIESTVRRVLVCLLTGTVLATTACTRMPVEHSQLVPQKVNAGKMQLVAETRVGATTRYVDSTSGASVEITVLSEYFSAGGRKCRRFLQGSSSQLSSSNLGSDLVPEAGSGTSDNVFPESPPKADTRLACEDSKSGWIEIPIHSIAG